MATKVFDLYAEISLDNSSYMEGLKTSENAGKDFESKLKDNTGKTKTGFDTLSTAVSACKTVLATVGIGFTMDKVIKGLSEAYNEATKLDEKLRGASTLYGSVAVDQTKLVDNLKSISLQTGESLEVLGQTVYDAMSAGVQPTEDMADVLKVVDSSSKLAKAGFTDTNTAMKASLSVINAYGMGIENINKVSDILLNTQNLGVTTVGELSNALSKVTPVASAFGVSIENVTSALALMTKQGTNTEVASTGLSSILSELGKSGTTASENLQKASLSAGLTETSFKGLLDSGKSLGDILDIMSDYAEQNNLSLVDMFSSIEAGKSALQITNAGAEEFNKTLDSMETATGLVSESFEKMVTPSQKLDSAIATLKTTIGEKLKPAIDGGKEALANMITKMLGQEEKSKDLETALKELKDALDNYSSSQENAKEKTDATTESMKLFAQDSVRIALKTLGDSWESFEGNLLSTQEEIKNVKEEYVKLGEKIIYYAGTEEYGLKLVGEDEFENLQSFEEQVEYAITALIKHAQNFGTYIDGTDNVMKKNIVTWSKSYYDLKENLKKLEEQQDKNTKKFAESADVLANYVEKGELSLNEIYIYAQSLYDDVVEILSNGGRKYKDLGESIEETNEDIKETTSKTVDTLRMKMDLIEEKIKEDIPSSIDKAKTEFSSFTSSFVENIDKINNILLTLPSDSEYQDLFGLNLAPIVITKMITAISNAKESFSDFESSAIENIEEINKSLLTLPKESPFEKIFGNVDNANIFIVKTRTAFEQSKGVFSDFVSSATQEIDGLYDMLSNPPTPQTLTPFLVDTKPIDLAKTKFSQASQSILNDADLTKVEIYNVLREIAEEYDLTLSDVEILSRAKAEATREVWKDFATGFKEDMTDVFYSVMKSFETLGETLANGDDMWNSFASVALKALKQVLESLGNQLTTLAVTKALMGDWVGAGLASAGAVLAYTTAGVANAEAKKMLEQIGVDTSEIEESKGKEEEEKKEPEAPKTEQEIKQERISSLEEQIAMLEAFVDNKEQGVEIPEQYQQDAKIRELQDRIRELESRLNDTKEVTVVQNINTVPMTPYELEQQAYIMAERLQWS